MNERRQTSKKSTTKGGSIGVQNLFLCGNSDDGGRETAPRIPHTAPRCDACEQFTYVLPDIISRLILCPKCQKLYDVSQTFDHVIKQGDYLISIHRFRIDEPEDPEHEEYEEVL